MPTLHTIESKTVSAHRAGWLEDYPIDLPSGRSSARSGWRLRRKAVPCDRLLPATLQWAETLPPEVMPRALLAEFPHVANLIAANWKEFQDFRTYVNSLLLDRRGNRQGFPPHIVRELVRLRTFYYVGDDRAPMWERR